MRTRRYIAMGTLTLVCFAATATGSASAADPVLASSCSANLRGLAGQQILLDPHAVTEPIAGALAKLDPLGVLAGPFRDAWNQLPPIPVGAIPAGDSVIAGTEIADAVVAQLRSIPVIAPALEALVPVVHASLSTACGILAHGDQPQPPGSGGPTAPSQPGGPGSGGRGPSGGGSGQASAQTYEPGQGARFGVPLSGLLSYGPALNAGVPGSPADPGVTDVAGKNAALVNPQRPAGNAQALPAEPDGLSGPVLAAVLMLTLVGAQLVRVWVFRAQP